MLTINQLIKKLSRQKKVYKHKTPALSKNPQQKGVCVRVFTRSPKKPNSASRKVAKIRIKKRKPIDVYIPGEGHNLQEYSVVLMRGGRTPDLPGVKYKLIRGKYDLNGVSVRKCARSRYGAKLPNKI
jgi:small subunit ribosomal protein S12